jgi:hypothetical protein
MHLPGSDTWPALTKLLVLFCSFASVSLVLLHCAFKAAQIYGTELVIGSSQRSLNVSIKALSGFVGS